MRLVTILVCIPTIVLFNSASRAEDLVPYQASDWKYTIVPRSDPLTESFYAIDFDDASWPTGQAAFGFTNCPLAKTIHTMWSGESELLLRRTFVAPAVCDSQVVIHFAVDNNAIVYINGEQVYAASHGGCPNLDDYSVLVPDTILNSGSENLLAFRATDTARPCFADVRVEAATMAQPLLIDATTPLLAASGYGQSVAWGDYDLDDDQDIFLVRSHNGANKLFKNDGIGSFSDATTTLLEGGGNSLCAAWGDYDNDGDLDLYIGKHDGSANCMLRNDGSEGFADATIGDLGYSAYTNSASWGDYDRDGDLDLFLASSGGANRLLRNDGQGEFINVTTPLIENTGAGAGSAWGDFDADGDSDLFVANASGPCRLFRNDGSGVFSDATSGPLTGPLGAQGVAWGDYDNDGDLDLYISGTSNTNRLLRNEGGEIFSDVTHGPLGSPGQGRGAAWGDYDNDGDLDLCVVKDASPCQVLRNDDGQFSDVTAVALLRSERSQGAGWSDYDNDGDLDLYVSRFSGSGVLLMNVDVCDSNNHWVQLKLIGNVSNRFGVGARITVMAGGKSQLREVNASSGYLSFNSILEEFGLGEASKIDLLVVKWPSGIVQAMTDITPVDRVITIEEAATMGVWPETAPSVGGIASNYPDPFSARTRIPYMAAFEGRVRIKIYDVRGRLVRTVVDGVQPRGDHIAVWDGRDEAGVELSSSVYYYEIEGSGSNTKGKMVIRR